MPNAQPAGAGEVNELDGVSGGREAAGHGRGFWRQLRLTPSTLARGQDRPLLRQVDVALWGLVALAAATRLWNIGQPSYTV